MSTHQDKTHQIAILGILTAVVVILQYLGSFIHFGPFSISLVLIPIVVGAALTGPIGGAWLGLVFSIVVLIMDASAFLAISVVGTFITVITKGVLAGFCSGLIVKGLQEKNRTLAVGLAAVVCPIVNTGIFLIGCRLFFFPTIMEWAGGSGYGTDVYRYMILGLVGANFLAELVINLVLSPVIVRLVDYADSRH